VCVCVCMCRLSVCYFIYMHSALLLLNNKLVFFSSLLSPLVLRGREEKRQDKRKKREEEGRRRENDRVPNRTRGTLSLSLSLLSSLFPYLDSSIRAYHEGGRRTSASGQTR